MADSQEREIGDVTVTIDRLLCVGFGDCIDVAPAAFEFDDENIAVFRESADEVDHETLLEACRACPVDALAVFDEDGSQLAP